ncbi:MAG: bidirectional hydrogenase complex protein HoxE [Vicinamibacterales bacterium]|jgi:bidirectional [NiFe] hydrogenase diaphorase subunit|nr:bidirectional hydrogenase complex protein HoxE [Vicinamibacterales bacterium]
MPLDREKPTPPARDNRWKLVEATMRRHGHRAHSLIESLHSAQESYGYLEPQVLAQVAHDLRVPLSKVYGVATFYNFFTLKPQGRHTCVVCTGTACYIKGAGAIMNDVEKELGLKAGQTSPGGEVSLLTARCFGSCGLAPAAVFDGEVAGKLAVPDVVARLKEWMRHDA